MCCSVLKLVALIVACVTSGLGVYSFFWSFWYTGNKEPIGTEEGASMEHDDCNLYDRLGDKRPYKICDDEDFNWKDFWKSLDEHTCPNIRMEQYFLSLAIISLVASTISLSCSIRGRIDSSICLRWLDVISHLLRAAMLFAGAVMYAVSAEQIKKILGTDQTVESTCQLTVHFLREEKLAAAGCAILQSLLYVIIAVQVCCCRRSTETV